LTDSQGNAGTPQRYVLSITFVLAWLTLSVLLWHHVTSFDYVLDDLGLMNLTNPAQDWSPARHGNLRLVHPLPYWLSNSLFGGDARPLHYSSIVIHSLNGLLVIWFGRLLFRDWKPAVVAGLIWSFLPGNAVSVAWIVNHVDLLVTFFCLWSLILLEYALAAPSMVQRAAALTLSLCAAALAIVSKENALPLFVCVFAVAHMRTRCMSRALAFAVPYLALALAYVLIVTSAGINYLKFRQQDSVIPLERPLVNIAGKALHYVEGLVLVVLPIPAIGNYAIAVCYAIVLLVFVSVTLQQWHVFRENNPVILVTLAVCFLGMQTPGAITTDLRVFYCPSTFYSLLISHMAVTLYRQSARVRRLAIAFALVLLLAISGIAGRQVSYRFSPTSPRPLSALADQLRITDVADPSYPKLTEMCRKYNCQTSTTEGRIQGTWLNDYYVNKRVLVRAIFARFE
jgi:hypothetical protein